MERGSVIVSDPEILGQSMMLGDRNVGERIDAASRAHEEPLAVKAQQKLPGDSKSLNISRTDQWLVRGEAQNTFCGRSGPHVAFYR